MLPGEALLLAHLRFTEGVIERGNELGALAAQRIASARIDQRFDDALVAEPQVDAVAQLHERAVGCLAPARDDRRDRALAHVPHGAEPKADPAVADDGELV